MPDYYRSTRLETYGPYLRGDNVQLYYHEVRICNNTTCVCLYFLLSTFRRGNIIPRKRASNLRPVFFLCVLVVFRELRCE